MFLPLDVVLVDLSVDLDFLLLLISKNDENLKLPLWIHFYLSKKIWRETISHFMAQGRIQKNQKEWL